jgi:hypothetical protein
VDISLGGKKITRTLILAVVFLTLLNIPAQYIKFNYPRSATIWKAAYFFDVNGEANIPTLFSSLTLLFSAALLWLIADTKRKGGDAYAPHWFYLALIFLFLTVDEAASIHEISSYLVRLVPGSSGVIKKSHWLIPYGILVSVFALAYLKFLSSLPRRTKRLFIVSGVVFVAGAWGAEVTAGLFRDYSDIQFRRSSYHILFAVEEFLEMAGIVVFIHALASYIASEVKESWIRITPGTPEA